MPRSRAAFVDDAQLKQVAFDVLYFVHAAETRLGVMTGGNGDALVTQTAKQLILVGVADLKADVIQAGGRARS